MVLIMQKKLFNIISIVLVVTIVLSISSTNMVCNPVWDPDQKSITNKDIYLKIHDGRPNFIIKPSSSDDENIYFLKMIKILEFSDQNSNYKFEPNIDFIKKVVPLNAFMSWEISSKKIDLDNGEELLIFLNGTAKVHIGHGKFGYISISFIFHLYNNTATTGVKFDVVINQWPWQNTNNKLAIFFCLGGNSTRTENIEVSERSHGQKKEMHLMGYGSEYEAIIEWKTWALTESGNITIYDQMNTYSKYVELIFIYPHFENFLKHDPSVLLIGEKLIYTNQNLFLPVLSVIIASSVITYIVWVNLIKRKKF